MVFREAVDNVGPRVRHWSWNPTLCRRQNFKNKILFIKTIDLVGQSRVQIGLLTICFCYSFISVGSVHAATCHGIPVSIRVSIHSFACQWQATRQGHRIALSIIPFLANESVACMKTAADEWKRFCLETMGHLKIETQQYNWRDFNQVVESCVVRPHLWIRRRRTQIFWQISNIDRPLQLYLNTETKIDHWIYLCSHRQATTEICAEVSIQQFSACTERSGRLSLSHVILI